MKTLDYFLVAGGVQLSNLFNDLLEVERVYIFNLILIRIRNG